MKRHTKKNYKVKHTGGVPDGVIARFSQKKTTSTSGSANTVFRPRYRQMVSNKPTNIATQVNTTGSANTAPKESTVYKPRFHQREWDVKHGKSTLKENTTVSKNQNENSPTPLPYIRPGPRNNNLLPFTPSSRRVASSPPPTTYSPPESRTLSSLRRSQKRLTVNSNSSKILFRPSNNTTHNSGVRFRSMREGKFAPTPIDRISTNFRLATSQSHRKKPSEEAHKGIQRKRSI